MGRRDPLRIGVNLLFLLPGQVGGTEIYTRSLLGALDADAGCRLTLFTNLENHESFAEGWPGERVLCQVRATSRPRRVAWEQLLLPGRLRRVPLDVLFSPGFTTPLASSLPSVVTFHDLIWRAYPETFPRSFRFFLNTLIPLSLRRARRIIAVSASTRDLLCRAYAVPPAKVRVIHEAPSEALRRLAARPADPQEGRARLAALGVGPEYLLTVSTLAPHKNLPRLLAAFRELKRAGADVPAGLQLVLAGIKGRAHEEVAKSARELGLAEGEVRVTGWVDEPTLAALYRSARLFVYPSLHEGFGLPVLEAMEFEVPVACSRATSLPEVGGEAARYFDPLDVAEMSRVILGLLADRQAAAALVERGRAWRRRFSWGEAARLTRQVLEESAAGR